MPIPREKSEGEETFDLHCRAKLDPTNQPEREYEFSRRKLRFDFAFPAEKIAVEIDGGLWKWGRRNRGKGFEKDCFKLNLAAKLGWRVLRYSTDMVIKGDAINDILEVLR